MCVSSSVQAGIKAYMIGPADASAKMNTTVYPGYVTFQPGAVVILQPTVTSYTPHPNLASQAFSLNFPPSTTLPRPQSPTQIQASKFLFHACFCNTTLITYPLLDHLSTWWVSTLSNGRDRLPSRLSSTPRNLHASCLPGKRKSVFRQKSRDQKPAPRFCQLQIQQRRRVNFRNPRSTPPST
jgi:hypothetical protein